MLGTDLESASKINPQFEKQQLAAINLATRAADEWWNDVCSSGSFCPTQQWDGIFLLSHRFTITHEIVHLLV